MDPIAIIIIIIIVASLLIWWMISANSADNDSQRQATNTGFPRTYNENEPRSSSRGIDKFETKITKTKIKDLETYQFMLKGFIPIKSNANKIILATSIIDVTDDFNKMPVRSLFNQFQEINTSYFSSITKIGKLIPGSGWADWTSFGFAPEIALLPPKGGLRRIAFHTRILNLKHSSKDTDLNRFDTNYLNGTTTNYIDIQFPNDYGYLNFEAEAEKIDLLIIQIVIYVAMIDGVLHNLEGSKIKNWAKKRLLLMSLSKSEEMKIKFNNTIKQSHAEFKKGYDKTKYIAYLNEFNKLSNEIEKNTLFDLLLDVLVADGEAHSMQIELLNLASDKIEIDYKVIENLKDHKFLNLNNLSQTDLSLEEILDIDSNMTATQIKNKLNKMFTLWNSRTESLSNSSEREKANQMLDLIAQAREKYQ